MSGEGRGSEEQGSGAKGGGSTKWVHAEALRSGDRGEKQSNYSALVGATGTQTDYGVASIAG